MALSPLSLFGAAMAALCAVVFAVSARYVWRASAVVRADPVETLTDTEPGSLVRVGGEAERSGDDPLVAPFSGTESVAVRAEIEERRLSVLYLLPWYVTVHEVAGGVPFGVRTSHGTVSVAEPAHTVTLAKRAVETAAPGEEPSERVARFERESEGVPETTVWRDPPAVIAPLFDALSLGTRRYVEQRAELGEDVTVVGRVADDGLDPLVVSDRSPGRTLVRMAGTSFAGLAVGLLGVPIVWFAFLA